MRFLRLPPRAAALSALGLGALLLTSCSDTGLAPPTAPSTPQASVRPRPDAALLRTAVAAQSRHTGALLRIPGVVGTAVGLRADGRPEIRVLLETAGIVGIPTALDGVPVSTRVTGRIMALSDPTTRLRPAPLGFSIGHYAITAGSIGARVIDAAGNVYVLSNNHVLANSNAASIGDAIYQPGPYDGGTAADQVATLSAFQPIDFSGAANRYDAAIASTSTAVIGNASPGDDGYGAPSATIVGDGNGDGQFDDVTSLLGLPVQKYGRTTGLTHGTITGVNGSVTVCYEVLYIFCTKSALFTDQLIIDAPGFSGGGDSGSLIVTDDANHNPVALLFAGSSAQTIANRVDLVLARFGVRIDATDAPPPAPVLDVATTSVSAPATVSQGATVSVTVTVRNVGNQDVSGSFDVTLRDATESLTIGTQSVAGLAPGVSATRTFSWNTSTSSIGTHSLVATHSVGDDDPTNDATSATVTVNPPGTSTGMHVGDLDGSASRGSRSWSARVEITIHDANHQPLNGATVKGIWSLSGLNSNTCTTGELGGSGTCVVLYPSLRLSTTSITFHVLSVTMAGQTYTATDNHDVDGSSNGIIVKVTRP